MGQGVDMERLAFEKCIADLRAEVDRLKGEQVETLRRERDEARDALRECKAWGAVSANREALGVVSASAPSADSPDASTVSLADKLIATERERDEAVAFRNAPLRKQFAYAVWMAEDFVDEFAARTLDGRFRVTMTLGEPDERGVFTPIMYRHDDPLPEVARLERTVEKLREASIALVKACDDNGLLTDPEDEEFSGVSEAAEAVRAASSPDHAGTPEGPQT